MKKTLLIAIVCIMIDQMFKFLIINNFTLYHGIDIIPDFFSLLYVRNTGAAWNILDGNRLFLIVASFLALFAIYFIFIRNQILKKVDIFVYGVLIGGIMGNLIDRIFRGYVIDYLKFTFFGYHFPIFNFADMCIVSSVILILLLMVRGDKNAENNSGE